MDSNHLVDGKAPNSVVVLPVSFNLVTVGLRVQPASLLALASLRASDIVACA